MTKYYKLYGIDKYGTYILFISKSFFYRNFASYCLSYYGKVKWCVNDPRSHKMSSLKMSLSIMSTLWNWNFMSLFSGQLIFNNYELMELWAQNSLWNESQNIKPSLDKWLHSSWSMACDYLSIVDVWVLISKQFNPILYWASNHSSMAGFELSDVSKRDAGVV